MTLVSDKIFGTYMLPPHNNYVHKLENYQALLWWIFQTGKFLREMATLSFTIHSEISCYPNLLYWCPPTFATITQRGGHKSKKWNMWTTSFGRNIRGSNIASIWKAISALWRLLHQTNYKKYNIGDRNFWTSSKQSAVLRIPAMNLRGEWSLLTLTMLVYEAP